MKGFFSVTIKPFSPAWRGSSGPSGPAEASLLAQTESQTYSHLADAFIQSKHHNYFFPLAYFLIAQLPSSSVAVVPVQLSSNGIVHVREVL